MVAVAGSAPRAITTLGLALVALLVAALLPRSVEGHAKLIYPVPRSQEVGIKNGPCGPETGQFTGTFETIRPGPLTIEWEETISHDGAPYRLALSREASDDGYSECILLDHIPHNPSTTSPKRYKVTVDIPNVKCDKCAIQLLSVMVDKLPNNQNTCNYTRTQLEKCNWNENQCKALQADICFSNYHSCANVKIMGAFPRNQYMCPGPYGNWPFAVGKTSDTGIPIQPSTYMKLSATYTNDGWLSEPRFPIQYRTRDKNQLIIFDDVVRVSFPIENGFIACGVTAVLFIIVFGYECSQPGAYEESMKNWGLM